MRQEYVAASYSHRGICHAFVILTQSCQACAFHTDTFWIEALNRKPAEVDKPYKDYPIGTPVAGPSSGHWLPL